MATVNCVKCGLERDAMANPPFRPGTKLSDLGKELYIVGVITVMVFSERIYSVRFVGDSGYVVTYRQVDPLFTIDLSDPENP